MRKLVVFNNVTLDVYIAGVNGDFSWAHSGNDDAEFNAYVADNIERRLRPVVDFGLRQTTI